MNRFETFTGLVVPLDRPNVDTDQIIPKQYLKSTARAGFGVNLFDHWRYLDHGEPGQDHSQRRPDPEFTLNLPRHRGAQILLTRDNFGCGSSREHAVWALTDFGIRVVIAPSFAEIFYNNSIRNGLLPVALPAVDVASLFRAVEEMDGYRLTVDLSLQSVTTPEGRAYRFEIDPHRKERLLKGLDDIGDTLEHADEIRAYEQRRRAEAPWLFEDLSV